jgi:hypothetical protein
VNGNEVCSEYTISIRNVNEDIEVINSICAFSHKLNIENEIGFI